MKVKVDHRLSALLAIVDHHTVALRETFLDCNLSRHTQQVTKQLREEGIKGISIEINVRLKIKYQN